MHKTRKKLLKFSVTFVYLYSACQPVFASDLAKNPIASERIQRLTKQTERPGYTINFNNVSIQEYLKFISKIADINFIFEPTELNFNVTILSEEPTDLTNILAALVQELRIHGFDILDDGVNLVIHKADGVRQIATVVSDEIPFNENEPPALATRLFRIKNANPTSIEKIIAPMLSKNALIEVAEETRHLVITDTTSELDKVADILMSLDAPKAALEVESYSVKNNSPEHLVSLVTQIMMPLSEGNPFILVPQNETKNIFIVSTPFLVEKSTKLLEDLDAKVITGGNVLIYQVRSKSPTTLHRALAEVAEGLVDQGYAPEGLIETIDHANYSLDSHTIAFTGSPGNLDKIKNLLDQLDIQGKPTPGSENSVFFVYRPENKVPEEIAQTLKNIATNFEESGLADQSLLKTIRDLKVEKSSQSLIFTGDSQSIEDIETLVKKLDQPSEVENSRNAKFYIYKLTRAEQEQISEALNTFADNLEDAPFPDKPLIQAIDSMKWIQETNSLVFSGSQEALDKLKEILPTFDVLPENASEFLTYSPRNISSEDLLDGIESITKNLQASGLANLSLIKTLSSAKWVPSSGVMVFTGDAATLARVKELLVTVDSEGNHSKISTLVYRAKHVPAEDIRVMLFNLAENLPTGDSEKAVLESMQIAEDTNALVFQGPGTALNNIRNFIETIDTPDQEKTFGVNTRDYFIYELKNTSGSQIIKDLERLAKQLKASNVVGSASLIKTIRNIEWIKSTNSLYISGSSQDIKKVQKLVERFDQPSQKEKSSSYYIYRPEAASASVVQEELEKTAEALENSGLADEDLLDTIRSAKYVQSNNSLVFSGTPKAIDSIKELIATIESQGGLGSGIQGFGKKTFFVYKLKYVSGSQLLLNLKHVATDLHHNKTDDSSLISAINSARYIPESNSIIFTGPTATLQKIQELVTKFDTQAMAPGRGDRKPEGYLVYQPKHVPPAQLIQILKEFEQHLLQSGVEEPELFDTINSLKAINSTSTIIITGSADSTAKVEELLKRFDIPGKAGTQEPSIETIDDLSFLIYKLKYHQGSEIEDALKKIAIDLGKIKSSEKNQSLLDAIESVQWVQVTNSLIGTGTPQSLAKLKNLIKNIDTPLEQIFIEILVIETDLSNALNFGLRWGTQGKFRNKLGYSTGAFPKFGENSDGSSADPQVDFTKSLEKISATNTPTGGSFTQGFNLGVIGDLIYHKGTSYTALGSLLDALRQDGSSTIVLSQKVITQNNKPTSLFSGDNIPFTGSTVQNAGNNATVFTSNLEYKDIGVSLNITPRIGDDGLVSLNIDQEISEQLTSDPNTGIINGDPGGGNISTPSVNGISTSKTSMQTQATVPDQHFLVLSGIVRNTKSKQRSSIPCLGGLPIIGAAFQYTETQIQKRSVIIFVKPQIIQDFKLYKEITEDVEDIGRKESVAEDFDEALEFGKSPNDE